MSIQLPRKKKKIQFCILEKVGSQIIGETSRVAEAEEQSSNLSCLRCSGGTTGVAYGCNILRLWREKRLRTTAALKEDMLKVKNSNSQVHLRSILCYSFVARLLKKNQIFLLIKSNSAAVIATQVNRQDRPLSLPHSWLAQLKIAPGQLNYVRELLNNTGR